MTVEQSQQLMDQKELVFSRQREQAATQAAAADRRAGEAAQATARSELLGMDAMLLGNTDEFHGEDETWFEWTTVLRGRSTIRTRTLCWYPILLRRRAS